MAQNHLKNAFEPIWSKTLQSPRKTKREICLHWPIKPPFSALIMGYPPRMDGVIIIQCMSWIATAMHVVFKRIHIARNEVHVRCQAWSFAQNRTSGFISEPKKHIPYVFFNGALINKCDRITVLEMQCNRLCCVNMVQLLV
eukprot:1081846_1